MKDIEGVVCQVGPKLVQGDYLRPVQVQVRVKQYPLQVELKVTQLQSTVRQPKDGRNLVEGILPKWMRRQPKLSHRQLKVSTFGLQGVLSSLIMDETLDNIRTPPRVFHDDRRLLTCVESLASFLVLDIAKSHSREQIISVWAALYNATCVVANHPFCWLTYPCFAKLGALPTRRSACWPALYG